MYLNNFSSGSLSYSRERGMVLVVGLIMVLLITIIGVAAIRGSGLQESMAGNMRDRNIAFQAAESALREGEAVIGPTVTILPSFACAAGTGLCLDQSSTPQNSVVYWDDDAWDTNAKETDIGLDDVAAQPKYIVEELDIDFGASAAAEGSAVDVGGIMMTGDATPYRITARGFGLAENTEVIVQSTYKRL